MIYNFVNFENIKKILLSAFAKEREKWNSIFEETKRQSQIAKTEADRAEQYANIVAPEFYVDVQEAVLYMKPGIGVTFIVTDDCEIYYKLT